MANSMMIYSRVKEKYIIKMVLSMKVNLIKIKQVEKEIKLKKQ